VRRNEGRGRKGIKIIGMEGEGSRLTSLYR